MKKYYMAKILLSTILLLVSMLSFPQLQFDKGVLDLGSRSAIDIKALKLEGEVEFYWNQLIEPSDFRDSSVLEKRKFFPIPKSWSSYRIDGNKLPSEGFATYRFIIKKRPDFSSTIYGLKIPSVFTSYKIWVNGNLIASVGKVGQVKQDHNPKFTIQDIPFALDNNENVEIVFQISNYSHRRAGLPWPIYFGTYDSIKQTSRNIDILNLIVIGIILVIGMNHVNMYLFRRKDISNLYFGILSLVMILRNISTGDRIIAYIFPNINWELLMKIDNFSGYGTIPFFALFIYHLYPNDFPVKVKNVLVALGAIIAIVIFTTPPLVFGKINTFFELYLLTGGLYLTFGVLLPATIRKREGAFLTFIGMFLLYATAINDVLSSMGLVQTPYVAPYGLVIFMLLQSFTITSKSAKAINNNEDLSFQLAQEKEGLEKNIETRTKELQKQHDILIEHQEKEKIQSWINKGLAKINNVLSANKNDFSVLSRKVLNTLIKYMGVKLGALYVINEDEGEPYLQMIAQYGAGTEMLKKRGRIEVGSGLVGATFADNQLQVISNIPDNYLQVNSGLGSSKPNTLLLVPLSTDEAVFGVLELARFDDFKSEELDFVKKIAYSIATSLNTARMNDKNVNLIQQFQEQSADIQEKEEKMRESLEELEFYREQNEKLQKELQLLKGEK